MMEAELTLLQNMKVVTLWVIFPMLKNHPTWSSVDREMTKIPSNGQNTISVFDNKIPLLYFDFFDYEND